MGAETGIVNAIHDALCATGKVTLYRNSTGFAKLERIRFGIGLGGADLVGFVHGTGRFLAIEVKTATGRLSPQQRAWLAHVARNGGIAFVARSVDEALSMLREALS